MNIKGDSKVKYIIISIVIFLFIFFLIYFCNNDFDVAFINQDILNDEWFENLEYRNITSEMFGLEKWASIRYEIESNYTSFLTINTIKTLNLLDENELYDKSEDIVNSMLHDSIKLYKNSKISGERYLKNGHKTIYCVFDGIDNYKQPNENVKIIVEIWSCGIKGKSIVCLGFSQVSDNLHNNSNINTIYWEKIVGDLKGTFGNENYIRNDALIYNVICH